MGMSRHGGPGGPGRLGAANPAEDVLLAPRQLSLSCQSSASLRVLKKQPGGCVGVQVGDDVWQAGN